MSEGHRRAYASVQRSGCGNTRLTKYHEQSSSGARVDGSRHPREKTKNGRPHGQNIMPTPPVHHGDAQARPSQHGSWYSPTLPQAHPDFLHPGAAGRQLDGPPAFDWQRRPLQQSPSWSHVISRPLHAGAAGRQLDGPPGIDWQRRPRQQSPSWSHVISRPWQAPGSSHTVLPLHR